MEQSQYLKNLLRRLNEATEELQFNNEGNNTHTISTVRFQKDESQSNANYPKRQDMHQDDWDKQFYQPKPLRQQIKASEAIHQLSLADNSKTLRNNPALRFNPSKSRKKSDESHYRQLPSKRRPTTRRDKKDLIEVRDKLNDIVSFLNARIESNPEVQQIKKVVNMQDIKSSVSFKNQQISKNKQWPDGNKSKDLLYLPRYELSNAKLGKSIQIPNHPHHDHNKQYLNLKHSFDRINDINVSRPASTQHLKSFNHYANYNNTQRSNQHIAPPIHIRNQQQVSQPNIQRTPAITVNGRRINDLAPNSNNNGFHANNSPFSQGQTVRYLSLPPPNIYSPQNNRIIANPSGLSYKQQPIQMNMLPIYPNALSIGPPSFRRIIASRPLSTKRSSTQPTLNLQKQQRFAPNYLPQQGRIENEKQPRNAEIYKGYLPPNQHEDMQRGRLKKKANPNSFYKQLQNIPNHSQNSNLGEETKAKEQIWNILPLPKPYNPVTNNIENPFQKPEPQISKQSVKLKASAHNQYLKSIAQQSEQNHQTKKIQSSAKSSERLMSSVNSNMYISKVNRFEAGGSTKLKRKGIDVSSKQIYMSQYSRHP